MASFTRVSVDEMKFTPAHVEIVRGTSVRWEQSPKCVVRHCLEVVDPEENNQASSPALLPGEPWEHTFEACGDFHYRSLVYCFMKGTVKVVDAAPADVDADRADAPVKTRAIAVDATAAPASAAASSSSRDETPVPEPLFDDENVAAAEYAAPPRPRSPTANDPKDPKPEPATDARDRAWHACDRCARVFVSSTNLKRHVASHGNRRSSRNASSARSRRPKPPPASVDEIAAFFAGLSSEKKREALAAVAAPGSTGALVVHGIRARKHEAERDGARDCRERQSREGDCQSRETSPAVAYAAAGAAVAKVVETYSDTHETRTTVPRSETNTSTQSTESDITDSDLFDALAGASEGTCFGPRADVDPTTMCLDENLDAALAYCVEQALFVSYLEERSAEAEAARKTLLAEIDEQCAEEERRAARRAEARKAKKAKSRSARPRMSETETSRISETETVSETEEARALANAAIESIESIESSRSDDGDDDRGGTVVPGGSRALSNASTPPPRETRRETRTRRTEVPGPGSPAAAEAERGACRRGRTDFRGDSAKGDGATPAPLSAPRTTAPADAASAEKQKQKQNGNQKPGNARPTTAPPSYHPPPNLPSASVAARRSPLAVPAPRRAASLASSSAAAIGDANDDAIVRPRLEPASRFAPPKADGDAEKASVVSASAPRKSRRALKAARALARAEGDAEASASATEVESASGSDLGYKTASDTDFSSGRSRVASRVSSAAPSRNAEGGAESSTRRARSEARAATETANANGPRIAENREAVPATAAGVQYPTSAARAPRNGSSRPAAADFEDARFASPAGTPATPVAMFASPPSAVRAIPVAPVWTPEREFARMAMRPPAFAAATPAGAAGMPPGVALGAPPSHHHPMHQLHHAAGMPPGIDPDVYMHHYATALAAIQASQAGAVAPHSGPGPAAQFAPPLPPGPPPHASRASR